MRYLTESGKIKKKRPKKASFVKLHDCHTGELEAVWAIRVYDMEDRLIGVHTSGGEEPSSGEILYQILKWDGLYAETLLVDAPAVDLGKLGVKA